MKRLLKVLLLLLPALAAAALWLLRSESGQAQLERWLRPRLPEEVRISGLGGALPFRGHLDVIELRDERGVWCVAQDVQWTLQPRSLLRRELVLRTAAGARVDLLRLPAGDGARPDVTPRATSRWSFWVQSARVDDLVVDASILGERLSVQLETALRGDARAWTAAASASTTWRDEALLLVGSARAAPTGSTFEIRRLAGDGFEAQAQGGWAPERRIEVTGAFTNAPLLARLARLERSGAGRFSGTLVWREDGPSAGLKASISDARGFGIELQHGWGSAAWTPNGWQATVVEADGRWRGEPWRLAQPVELSAGAGGIRWNAPAFAWAGLAAESRGMWSTARVDAVVRLPAVDLGASPVSNRLRAGIARAELRVSGTPDQPHWLLEAEADGVVPRVDSTFQLNPAQVRLRAEAVDGEARVDGRVEGWTREPVRLQASMPLHAPLNGSPVTFNPTGAVAGALAFEVDLAQAGRFADLRGASLQGLVACDLTVGGTWSSPAVNGRLTLERGRAEFPDSGTVLQHIEIDLRADRDQLVIARAEADDGAGGRIALDGALRFLPAEGFPLEAGLRLHRAALWRQDGRQLRLDGRVAVRGPVTRPAVTGRLDLVDAELRLRPTPPTLRLVPIDDPAGPVAAPATTSAWLQAIALDVAVRGRDIRVAGRGLDSVWRADLRVDGVAASPRLRGPLTVERGYFLFMGRRFTLDRAVLSFDGRTPPAPVIDLAASARAGDMQARLYAAGPIDAPALHLESDPAYPADEILARLLFGRSTDAISPFQAVRLAHGLNVLRGRGRTLDVLERGQSILRVDQLELVQSDEAAEISAISVGKYVGRNIYVEGEKGLGESADLITVEVELTPSLILTTESSPRIREGIGLKWRRDY
jgi:autotransporter translocation and assembly factor TamB